MEEGTAGKHSPPPWVQKQWAAAAAAVVVVEAAEADVACCTPISELQHSSGG
jgi:hypothetical protein